MITRNNMLFIIHGFNRPRVFLLFQYANKSHSSQPYPIKIDVYSLIYIYKKNRPLTIWKSCCCSLGHIILTLDTLMIKTSGFYSIRFSFLEQRTEIASTFYSTDRVHTRRLYSYNSNSDRFHQRFIINMKITVEKNVARLSSSAVGYYAWLENCAKNPLSRSSEMNNMKFRKSSSFPNIK